MYKSITGTEWTPSITSEQLLQYFYHWDSGIKLHHNYLLKQFYRNNINGISIVTDYEMIESIFKQLGISKERLAVIRIAFEIAYWAAEYSSHAMSDKLDPINKDLELDDKAEFKTLFIDRYQCHINLDYWHWTTGDLTSVIIHTMIEVYGWDDDDVIESWYDKYEEVLRHLRLDGLSIYMMDENALEGLGNIVGNGMRFNGHNKLLQTLFKVLIEKQKERMKFPEISDKISKLVNSSLSGNHGSISNNEMDLLQQSKKQLQDSEAIVTSLINQYREFKYNQTLLRDKIDQFPCEAILWDLQKLDQYIFKLLNLSLKSNDYIKNIENMLIEMNSNKNDMCYQLYKEMVNQIEINDIYNNKNNSIYRDCINNSILWNCKRYRLKRWIKKYYVKFITDKYIGIKNNMMEWLLWRHSYYRELRISDQNGINNCCSIFKWIIWLHGYYGNGNNGNNTVINWNHLIIIINILQYYNNNNIFGIMNLILYFDERMRINRICVNTAIKCVTVELISFLIMEYGIIDNVKHNGISCYNILIMILMKGFFYNGFIDIKLLHNDIKLIEKAIISYSSRVCVDNCFIKAYSEMNYYMIVLLMSGILLLNQIDNQMDNYGLQITSLRLLKYINNVYYYYYYYIIWCVLNDMVLIWFMAWYNGLLVNYVIIGIYYMEYGCYISMGFDDCYLKQTWVGLVSCSVGMVVMVVIVVVTCEDSNYYRISAVLCIWFLNCFCFCFCFYCIIYKMVIL